MRVCVGGVCVRVGVCAVSWISTLLTISYEKLIFLNQDFLISAIKPDIIRCYLSSNTIAVKLCNQKYEYIAVKKNKYTPIFVSSSLFFLRDLSV